MHDVSVRVHDKDRSFVAVAAAATSGVLGDSLVERRRTIIVICRHKPRVPVVLLAVKSKNSMAIGENVLTVKNKYIHQMLANRKVFHSDFSSRSQIVVACFAFRHRSLFFNVTSSVPAFNATRERRQLTTRGTIFPNRAMTAIYWVSYWTLINAKAKNLTVR
jgi:hypothetical protein